MTYSLRRRINPRYSMAMKKLLLQTLIFITAFAIFSLTMAIIVAAEFTLTDYDKAAIVMNLNAGRGSDVIVPPASDMNRMVWSSSLEETAQTEVETCQYSTTLTDVTIRGLRLVQVTGASRNSYFDLVDMVLDWFSFAKYYDYDTNSCTSGKGLYCKIFKVISWATASSVGCSIKLCTTIRDNEGSERGPGIYWKCLFSDVGYFWQENRVPWSYSVDGQCTNCISGSGWCLDGLCEPACTSSYPGCTCSLARPPECGGHGTLDPEACECTCEEGYEGNMCSDSDGRCFSGWSAQGSKCVLHISSFNGTHQEAQDYCQLAGGNLLIIQNESENELHTQTLGQSGFNYTPLRCFDDVLGGYWVCGDTLPWYYDVDGHCNGYWEWAPSDPDNAGQPTTDCNRGANCAFLNTAGTWNDDSCSATFPMVLVCEKLLYNGTCSDGWLQWSDRCFNVNPRYSGSWLEAKEECATKGGSLLGVKHQEENAYATSILVSSGKLYLPLQCDDIDSEGKWTCATEDEAIYWRTSKQSGYWKWSDGEPLEPADEAGCLYLGTDGSWVARPCNTSLAMMLVCQSYPQECFDGYVKASDGVTCKDIDECTQGINECEQLCINTMGSYQCGCEPEYDLDFDGRSCYSPILDLQSHIDV